VSEAFQFDPSECEGFSFQGAMRDSIADLISTPVYRRGAQSAINDEALHKRRNELVIHLENYWGFIGWNLPRCHEPNDLIPVLDDFSRRDLGSGVEMFCRKTKTSFDEIEFCRARMEFRHVIRRWDASVKMMEKDRLAPANQRKRREELYEMQRAHQTLRKRKNKLETLFEEVGPSFGRAEILNFMQVRAQGFTPLNLANAVAGLPLMGWRQSMYRCFGSHCHTANSQIYLMFKDLCELINGARLSTENQLISSVKERVFLLRSFQELSSDKRGEYCCFVERAIKRSFRIHPRTLPFEIVRQYVKQFENCLAATAN
jgi:hypothetical protein